MTLQSQKIDAGSIQSSARFDSLDTQTQRILAAITDTKESLSHDLFECLTRLICRSEAVNKDEHQEIRQITTPSTVDGITAQIEMLSVGHKEEQLLRRTIQQTLLELLQYPYMTGRYEQLMEAHPETFGWIFCNSDEWEFPWTNFEKWLRYGQGIYWVNGKPASGKSTLMKHIYDDTRTRRYLEQWGQKGSAGSAPCCLATFFFWSTGTTLQKSQNGLLRSLLFQVLGQHPDLIPLALPARWIELYTGTLSIGERIHPNPWSSTELYEAFERLIRQTQYPLKICFLIDGLDEFSGDKEQLCLFFKRLSTMSDATKICLSSRPWVEFKNNFEDCASLRLQDLTARDISRYINDKLNSSAVFTKLATRNTELASNLSSEIVNRAEGVFLWVDIVVHLLLKGINNRDTIPQLWTRLRSFPSELHGLYESILSQIEPMYLDWALRAFQVMVASEQLGYDPFRRFTRPGTSIVTPEGDESVLGVSPLTLLEFSFALQEDYNLDDANLMTENQLISQLEETLFHLTARCAGLLEVSDPKASQSLSASLSIIRWMHRTAHDFILGCTMWTNFMDDDCFRDPSICYMLMKGSLISLRELTGKLGTFIPYEHEPKKREEVFLSNAIVYAHHADGHFATRTIRSKLLADVINTKIPSETPTPTTMHNGRYLLIQDAALYGLVDFVEDTISMQDPLAQQASAKASLELLCSPSHLSGLQSPYTTRRMVDYLIKIGNFPPRIISRARNEEDLPAVAGKFTTQLERSLTPVEVLCFIESHLSIIQSFLEADADPTDSLGYLPKSFVLPLEAMQETITKSVEAYKEKVFADSIPITVILVQIKLSLIREARRQKKNNGFEKKRKRIAQTKATFVTSEESESDDVIFKGGRLLDQVKRVKFGTDD